LRKAPLTNNNEFRPEPTLQDMNELMARYQAEGHRFEAEPDIYRLLHHMERYWFVADALRGRGTSIKVIDMGCGNGVGLSALADRSPLPLELSGVEIDKAASEEAAKTLSMRVFNTGIEDLRISESFDAVICYETLGFNTLSSDRNLLAVLDGYCKPGGQIFISVPNYRGRRKKDYFERTYSTDELRELVESHFERSSDVECFGQLYPANRRQPGDVGVRSLKELSGPPDFSITLVQKK
jgi:2-polyprenyl-3-methyl-5-hydroxy-6-metoxy-1,4-benzoquinol methylase